MAIENATILIPDISGYTEFVSKTETEHGAHILNYLLETIVASMSKDFVVSEIEGDAVLLYKKGNPPTKKEIIEQCVKTFSAFHSVIKGMCSVSLCQCGACKDLVGLTLKFVVHFGMISENKVSRFVKASGLDMVIAHRLLKNSIESQEYLLVTQNYLNNIPDAGEPLELSWSPSQEDYSSIGIVEFHFAPLEWVKKTIQEIPKDEKIILTDGSPAMETEIASNFQDVFNAIINMEWRKYYVPGMKEVEQEINISVIGGKHTGVFDDFKMEVEPMKIEVKENEIVYAEYDRSAELNFYSVYEFIVTGTGDNRCKVHVHIFPEKGHTMADERRSFFMDLMRDTLKNLKAFAENGFQPAVKAEA